MPSIFDQAFAPAQDRLFAIHGIPAQYGRPGHSYQNITVCIDGFDVNVEQYPEVWVAAATVQVRASEVAEPAVGDVVAFPDTENSPVQVRGKTYQVGDIVDSDTLGSTLALSKQMVRI